MCCWLCVVRVVGDVDPYGMRGRNVGDDTRVVGDVDPYGLKDIQIIVGDDVLDVPSNLRYPYLSTL